MTLSSCLWCEASIKQNAERCAECGLAHPAVAAPRVRRAWHGRRLVAAVLAVPLMLSGAWATTSVQPAMLPTVIFPNPVASPAPVSFHDPVQQSVWTEGQSALRRTLGDPTYTGFAASFVNTSDGRVVSLCGTIAGTSGYDSPTGEERYLSVFGQATETVRQSQDMSFDVLWNRVCRNPNSAA
jgi:hypothetical protein